MWNPTRTENMKKITKKTKLKTAGQKEERKTPKVPYHYKPDGLTLEQWQIALRKQAAEKELFAISEMAGSDHPGYYAVRNPTTDNNYRVVYRGEDSPWNFCSCMDFKSSQLGTCKHIEAVKLWMTANHKRVYRGAPAYSSVYLSYKGERNVCLRIGTDNAEEFRQLAEPYFTPDGKMRPEAITTITDFLAKAVKLNDSFRWYPDALSFIMDKRDKMRREQMLAEGSIDKRIDTILKATLYPYQKEGIRFAFGAGKSIIADEMGLGKTIQAIGTSELMRQLGMTSSCLIICPTSLKYQWKKEIERFTDAEAIVVEGIHTKRVAAYKAKEFYKIVSYNSICNDLQVLKTMRTDFLIMDEVQRLKNWKTKISKAARRIDAEYAVILSGTPLENKLEELYSIMQFADQYCLGPYYQFMDRAVVKSPETGKVIGYKNLNAIGEQMKGVLLRRRKRDVALQLPARQDKILFVPMTEQQREMHEEFQSGVAQLVYKWTRTHFLSEKDRKRLLLMLGQMRMVCDSTYILDQKSRYDTKIEEIMNILHNVFESGDEKVVIFSQWERMTRLVAAELDKIGIRYEYLHGGVPSEKRKNLMDNFTTLPESRVFISTDAGSTGLNLQVASIIINIDLPWNPAVLEQRIARIYRIGQKRNIQVINLVASNTIEERMLGTLNFKSSMFEGILDNGEDSIFLEDSKLDKIMEDIKGIVEEPEDKSAEQTSDGRDISLDDSEEKKAEPQQTESSDTSQSDTMSSEEDSASSEDENTVSPDKLINQGLSFFSGLARTLSSPEKTKQLVDSIVDVDEKTGKTVMKIEIPDKESVTNILGMLGKLFGK